MSSLSSQVIAMMGILFLAGIFLGALAASMWRRNPNVAEVIDRKFAELDKLIKEYADVKAVVSLMERFKQNPEFIGQLGTYSEDMLAAALAYRIKQLSAQHKGIENEITGTHAYYNRYGGDRTDAVARLERDAARVLNRLTEMRDLAKELGVNTDSLDSQLS